MPNTATQLGPERGQDAPDTTRNCGITVMALALTVLIGVACWMVLDAQPGHEGTGRGPAVIMPMILLTIAVSLGIMQKGLRDSQTRYQAVFENTGTVMCMIAEDGTVILVNEEFARRTGRTKREVEGQCNFTELIASEDVDRVLDYHEARRRPGGNAPGSYEIACLDAEGNRIHCLITVELVPGTSTSIASLIDITERKQAEEEMRLTNARLEMLHAMSQEINDGVAPCDAVQNSCDRLKELLGCHYVELFLPGIDDDDEDAGAPAWAMEGPLIARSCAPLVTCGTEPREFGSREELLGMISELVEVRSRDAEPIAGRILDALRLSYAYLVPVPEEGRVLGQLAVGSRSNTALPPPEKRFLEQYAEQVGLLIARSQMEQALRDSESRYRLLFNGANDAMYVQPLPGDGPPGSFSAVNDVACEMLGYERKQLLQMSQAEIEAPGRWSDVPELLERLEGGEHVIHETVHLTRDGTEIPVEVSSHLFELAGEPTLLSIARDITERKRAEEELRQSKLIYESLFEACPTSLLVHDIDTGEVVDANRRAIAEYGFASLEELRSEAFSLEAPYSFEDAQERIQETAQEGSRQFEWLSRRSDGELFWEQIRLTRATVNGVDRVLAATTNITAQKQTEQRLRRVNECFLGFTADPGENTQRLIELCGEVLDADWAAYVRLDGARLRGVACWHLPEGLAPPPDPTGLVCEMVMKADDSDVFHLTGLQQSQFAAIDPSVRDFGAVSYLGKAVQCDVGILGCVCTFYRDHYEPTEEDRRLIGIIAAAIRVEEERMAVRDQHDLALADLKVLNREMATARREAEDANNLKSEFLANTSHEIRTPLNGIIGYLQLVLNGLCDDPEEEREFIAGAHESAERLLALINDVLDVARIEAGKLRVDPEEVEIATLLSDVHSIIRVQAEQNELELIFHPVEDDLAGWCDEERLRQVLLNLLGNALKFTATGGTITVDVAACHDEGLIRFEIVDTGIGIEPEKLDTIFEKFVQADGSTTRQRGGSGLGLTISQRLVEMMGGAISAHSDGEGCGATFRFTIPLHRPDAGIDRGASAASPHAARDPARPLALVVEDDPIYREYLRSLFAEHGCDTLWAATADDAMTLLESHVPCAITIDYSLPALEGAQLNTGWDLLIELQKDGRLSEAQMLLITGETDVIGRKLAFEQLPDRVEVLDKRRLRSDLAGSIERVIVTGEDETPVRILLADDDPAFGQVLGRLLEGRGYELHQVFDGAECIDYLREHAQDTDLLLLDLRMPAMSGYDVLRDLRRRVETLALPVLVVTAYPEPEDLEQRIVLAGGGRIRMLTKQEVLADPSRLHTLIEQLLAARGSDGRASASAA